MYFVSNLACLQEVNARDLSNFMQNGCLRGAYLKKRFGILALQNL